VLVKVVALSPEKPKAPKLRAHGGRGVTFHRPAHVHQAAFRRRAVPRPDVGVKLPTRIFPVATIPPPSAPAVPLAAAPASVLAVAVAAGAARSGSSGSIRRFSFADRRFA
jgi:hypothetical protein